MLPVTFLLLSRAIEILGRASTTIIDKNEIAPIRRSLRVLFRALWNRKDSLQGTLLLEV